MRTLFFLLLSLSLQAQVVITSPKSYQVFQRENNEGDIKINGTYTGSPTTIQVKWGNGSWQNATIYSTQFFATIHSQQGQKTLYVKKGTYIDSVKYVGIGDVYVTAGQSNMVGYSYNIQYYQSPSSNPNLKASVFTTENGVNIWKNCEGITCVGSLGGSILPLLATKLLQRDNVPVAFITTARISTGLVTLPDWKKGASTGSHCYEQMLSLIQASKVNKVKLVLWHQGESDACYHVSSTNYYNALVQLALNVKTDIVGNPKLVVAQLGPMNEDNCELGIPAIRNAQAIAWQTPNIVKGPKTQDISISDWVHFQSNAELALLAQRWFEALNVYENSNFQQELEKEIEKPKVRYGFATLQDLENYILGLPYKTIEIK